MCEAVYVPVDTHWYIYKRYCNFFFLWHTNTHTHTFSHLAKLQKKSFQRQWSQMRGRTKTTEEWKIIWDENCPPSILEALHLLLCSSCFCLFEGSWILQVQQHHTIQKTKTSTGSRSPLYLSAAESLSYRVKYSRCLFFSFTIHQFVLWTSSLPHVTQSSSKKWRWNRAREGKAEKWMKEWKQMTSY